ncbi:kelch-like protein 12 [Acropora muricata]|uniref:kelch-like protein 12 n=1 Tax=Acropora muricata TaxID=159855 RepID=UPI0034E3EAC4
MEESVLRSEGISIPKQAFIPRETEDNPFDITLIAKDSKEFQAHSHVLSEASSFFEKLLNCGMRESNEGVVRLETVTQDRLRNILEFVYTGTVDMSTEDSDHWQELLAIADFLVLLNLKTFVGKILTNRLDPSNAFQTYYLAEKFECLELLSNTKGFILKNFLAISKTDDFAELSYEEIKMWIASDEIEVSAEEDVYQIIVSWIDHERKDRRKYLAELFAEVRLAYVSNDFLRYVVTTDLVKGNEECMNLVKYVARSDDFRKSHLHVKPRKSLETPVIALYVSGFKKGPLLCYYFPEEDLWARATFPDSVSPSNRGSLVSCRGMLYFVSKQMDSLSMLCYNTFSDSWTTTSHEENRSLKSVFVGNEEDIYALLGGGFERCLSLALHSSHGLPSSWYKTQLSYITKYSPESDSWVDVATLNFDLNLRSGTCIVAKGNYIYFVGGFAEERLVALQDADRYDLITKSWEKIASLLVPRWNARGAAAHRNIFIIGGVDSNSGPENCEMYDTSTNEWHFIAKLRKTPSDHYSPCLLGVDNKLYSIICCICTWNRKDGIDLYDHKHDVLIRKTQIPLETLHPKGLNGVDYVNVSFCCAMKVLKQSKFLKECSKADKQKCAMM